MPSYPRLFGLLADIKLVPPDDVALRKQVVPYLVEIWLTDYSKMTSKSEIVEVCTYGFYYLFDIINQRLISAWGISKGRSATPRDKSRMRGHPQSYGPLYHRGHAITHTLGGPTDINLVPQLGSVNISGFRNLENLAVKTPGTLYFTYWMYGNSPGQKPHSVEQGLLCPGQVPDIRRHQN
jgi:hypothetical protein